MEKRKLVITHEIDAHYSNQITALLPGWEIIIGKDKAVWQEHLKDAEIIAGWRKWFEEYCLSSDSKLKWLQSWSAGVDSLPLEKLSSNNIILTSANGVHAYPISETIFALMLGLTRKIHAYLILPHLKEWGSNLLIHFSNALAKRVY